MDEEKQKKVGMAVIGVMVIGLVFYVYAFVLGDNKDSVREQMSNEDMLEMDVQVDEAITDRMDIKKKREESFLSANRKVQSNDDFFSYDKIAEEVVEEQEIEKPSFLTDAMGEEQETEKPSYITDAVSSNEWVSPIKDKKTAVKQTKERKRATVPVKEKIVYIERKNEDKTEKSTNRFYSASREKQKVEKVTEQIDEGKAGNGNEDLKGMSDKIFAVIHKNQEINNGTRVTMRTVKKCVIDGIKIPSNVFFYGTAFFVSNNRVGIRLNSITFQVGIQPYKVMMVEKSPYDSKDGLVGVYTPTDFKQEAGGDVSDVGLDALEKTSSNIPVVGGLMSSLTKKKVKEPSRMLRDGHQVVIY